MQPIINEKIGKTGVNNNTASHAHLGARMSQREDTVVMMLERNEGRRHMEEQGEKPLVEGGKPLTVSEEPDHSDPIDSTTYDR